MPTIIKLRFDALPSFETAPIYCALETDTEVALRALPKVRERAIAALRFCQRVGADAASLLVQDDEVAIMQLAHLRAALMDYVGMEEVLPVDLAARGRGEAALTIADTADAMLVVLRELRHLQLHLATTVFESATTSAVLRAGEHEIQTEVTIRTVPRDDLLQLKSLRNARRFDGRELDRAISWFADAQSRWGVADVVLAGVQRYAEVIVARYGLEAA